MKKIKIDPDKVIKVEPKMVKESHGCGIISIGVIVFVIFLCN